MATREQLGTVVERLIEMIEDDTHAYHFEGLRWLMFKELETDDSIAGVRRTFIEEIVELAEYVEVTNG